jgi:hypothetical protein
LAAAAKGSPPVAQPPPPPRAYVRALATARRYRRMTWVALTCAAALPLIAVSAFAFASVAGLATSDRTAYWAGKVSCPILLVMVIVAVACEYGARGARHRAQSMVDEDRRRAGRRPPY